VIEIALRRNGAKRSAFGLLLAKMLYCLKMIPAQLSDLDERGLNRISNSSYLAPFSPLFIAATYLGDGYLWGGLALFLMLQGEIDRQYVLIGLGITIINVIIYTLIKIYFKRERPIPFSMPLRSRMLERYSFPSGHSSASFGVALMVAHFYPILWAQIGIYLIAAFISLSRIYVREHYPSDVIAGAILGTLITGLLLPIFKRFIL
jgi:undecaprenyl-diphosphatase